ncbi:MAG: response regulator, partial [Verrucomicrobiota bacterium]
LTEGGDVQLDRSVVDQLYGPLLHVVRNAVAHGIEAPEKRERLGKNRIGEVKIRAESKSDHVIIEIVDDGAGISEDAVRKKAIQNGLLDANVSSISSQQAIELLFSPGFSTKETVSNVAGRGVGLDVVKGEIEGLNGSVGVTYESGNGTTWRIRVPLTLSASEALIVLAGSTKTALPLGMVDRCIRLTSLNYSSTSWFDWILVNGERLPIINLGQVLNIDSREKPTHAIIIDSGMSRAALAVHGMIARREIVLKDLGPVLEPLGLYSGVTTDADGSLITVLQIPFLLEWINKQLVEQEKLPDSSSEKNAKETRKGEPRVMHILLADDSPSVRKVQEKELKSLGFEVSLAKNGQEAIEQLSEKTVDLLVTDWEMPKIDGNGLIQAVRNNPAIHNLPIIVISSKVDEVFESEAIALGANACLCKPFQKGRFIEKLKTIQSLVEFTAKLEDSSTFDA